MWCGGYDAAYGDLLSRVHVFEQIVVVPVNWPSIQELAIVQTLANQYLPVREASQKVEIVQFNK